MISVGLDSGGFVLPCVTLLLAPVEHVLLMAGKAEAQENRSNQASNLRTFSYAIPANGPLVKSWAEPKVKVWELYFTLLEEKPPSHVA